MLNIRVEKIQPLRFKVCLRNLGHNGPEINEKNKFLDSCSFFLNMYKSCFVEFWKIIPVFGQEKGL